MKQYINSIYSKYIHIYKNKYNKPVTIIGSSNIPKINKVVVFDLDETIGSFGELMVLWKCLELIKEKYNLSFEINQDLFNLFIDLYPECLRHGILVIFEYLLHKKQKGECSKIFIYTNNKGSPHWPNKIKGYLDYKLNVTDFIDKIIHAFKINNVIIEPMRTDVKKKYTDFIRCSILSKKTEICFIDDTYYHKMKHDKIYYIQPKSYNHKLLHSQILNRLFQSDFFIKKILYEKTENKEKIIDFITRSFKESYPKEYNNQLTIETSIDVLISQKIMYHIKEFFYLTTRNLKTRKIKIAFGNFTRKKRR